jgi:hypothetical protein
MEENLLRGNVPELFSALHAALVEENLQRLEPVAWAVDRYLIHAVKEGDRVRLRELVAALTGAASTAAALHTQLFPLERWHHRWLTLADIGELVLAEDLTGVAREDLDRLQRFQYAVPVLGLLADKGFARLGEIEGLFAGTTKPKQACSNHLRRLLGLGLLNRVAEGLYRLSRRGQAVAALVPSFNPVPAAVPVREAIVADFRAELRRVRKPGRPRHDISPGQLHFAYVEAPASPVQFPPRLTPTHAATGPAR